QGMYAWRLKVTAVQVVVPVVVHEELEIEQVPVAVPEELEVEDVRVVVLESEAQDPDVVRCNLCRNPYVKRGLCLLRPEAKEAVLVEPVSVLDKLSSVRWAPPCQFGPEVLGKVYPGKHWG